jgi:hypothetical protein
MANWPRPVTHARNAAGRGSEMKQKVQIISESLYEIQVAVNRIREIVCDLTYCGISTGRLTRAIEDIEGYRVAVATAEQERGDEMQTPHTDTIRGLLTELGFVGITDTIHELLAEMGYPRMDPRHVEAYIRIGNPTMDHLSKQRLREEVLVGVLCIQAGGVDAAERVAQSQGL